jgi:hypothetical protein
MKCSTGVVSSGIMVMPVFVKMCGIYFFSCTVMCQDYTTSVMGC